MKKLSREHVAYHEAGHFVARYKMHPEWGQYQLNIEPLSEKGVMGQAKGEEGRFFEEGPHGSRRVIHPAVEDGVTELYTGLAAEMRYDPNCRRAAKRGAYTDDRRASYLLRHLLGLSVRRRAYVEAKLRKRAVLLVDAHWNSIEALAKELLKSKSVDSTSAANIVKTAESYREAMKTLSGDISD